MLGFLIIAAFEFFGLGLHKVGVPLPASVIGLLLLVIALATGVVKIEWVERSAAFMLRHMMLLFVPILAGLPALSADLRRDAVALIASTVVSSVAVLLITGRLADSLMAKAEAK